MKYRKHLGIWLLITLVMALAIGAVAAVTLSGRTDESSDDSSAQTEESAEAETSDENSSANPSGYLSNQRQHDIDLDVLGTIMGEYKAASKNKQESGISETYWHLSIQEDHGDDGPYLSVYNGDTDEAGFEGRIMYLKDNVDDEQEGYLVIVEIDEDKYKSMPEDWSTESDGKYAILNIYEEDDNLLVGYRGTNILFVKE